MMLESESSIIFQFKKPTWKKQLCFVAKMTKNFFKGMTSCCKTPDNKSAPPTSLVTRVTQTECLSVVHQLSHEGETMMHRKKILSSENSSSRAAVKKSCTCNGFTQLSLDALEAAYLNSGVVGLVNLGDTSYMNSVIQCLSHTLELTDIFLSCDKKFRGSVCTEYKNVMRKIWLLHSKCEIIATPLQSIFKGSEQKYVDLVTLLDLKKTIGNKFSTFEQNAALEFLRHMMSCLHNEMKPIDQVIPETFSITDLSDYEQGKVKWEWYKRLDGSPIANIFMGQFKISLQCTICKNTSPTFEPFWDMGLPIDRPRDGKRHVDLHRCLSLFAQNETMDGDNKPWCRNCHKNRRSIKTMTVSRFPPVLILYMKRFASSDKLITPVRIPLSIDLTTYSSPETVEDFGGAKIRYELYGVVNHVGTLHSGHYTADVKHFTSQLWFNYNDDCVCRCSHFQDVTSIISTKAYILFYRRTINSAEMCTPVPDRVHSFSGVRKPAAAADAYTPSLNLNKSGGVSLKLSASLNMILALNHLIMMVSYIVGSRENGGSGD